MQLRHRILGIDPGSRSTGFGVIDTDGRRSRRVASGCIRVGGHPWPERLGMIFDAVVHGVRDVSVWSGWWVRKDDKIGDAFRVLGESRGLVPQEGDA